MAAALPLVQWKLIENDSTTHIISDNEHKYVLGCIERKLPLITLQDGDSIGLYDIKKIIPYTANTSKDIQIGIFDWTKYSTDILQKQYDAYVENKKRFKINMLAGKFTGYPNPHARERYLAEYYDDAVVSFEEFTAQHNRDADQGIPNKYMQEFFWDDPWGFEEIGFMTEKERRAKKRKVASYKD